MCVIIAKPAGVCAPSVETLIKCFKNNPHGAGIAIGYKNGVLIEKGFMTIGKLLSKLPMIIKDQPAIIHFRISTNGLVDPRLTHPIPITTSIKKCLSRHLICNSAVVHNGTATRQPSHWLIHQSMMFVLNDVNRMSFPNDFPLLDEKLGASQLAMLQNNTLSIFGNQWFTYEDCWFSNIKWYEPMVYWRYNGKDILQWSGVRNRQYI